VNWKFRISGAIPPASIVILIRRVESHLKVSSALQSKLDLDGGRMKLDAVVRLLILAAIDFNSPSAPAIPIWANPPSEYRPIRSLVSFQGKLIPVERTIGDNRLNPAPLKNALCRFSRRG